MVASKLAAIILYAMCMAQGGECVVVEARVTSYVPDWGGINCDHDCSVGAFNVPLKEKVSAACGPSYPWNTEVMILAPWGEVITRYCHDRGGLVTDKNVDVFMTPEEHEEMPLYGHNWPVVFKLPEQAKSQQEPKLPKGAH